MAGARGDGEGVSATGAPAEGPGSVGGPCASWVGAVAVCRGTDLVVSPLMAIMPTVTMCAEIRLRPRP